ncbi:tRNA pseudouridine(55) synthase TruB [soil metagenome]
MGRATRLSRYVTGLDKTYTATARFGATSDTLDADGEITDLDTGLPNEDELRAGASTFTGELDQIPPMASAVKVDGERLYNVHRRGETVDRESRSIKVHSFDLVSYNSPERSATFRVSCSSGTYVRSLIADLADSLDTAAYLTDLRRESVGDLTVRDAATLDSLSHKDLYTRIIQPSIVMSHLPAVQVSIPQRREVANGREITYSGHSGAIRVESEDELLAIYVGDGSVARPEVVLCAAQ